MDTGETLLLLESGQLVLQLELAAGPPPALPHAKPAALWVIL